jgi:hypothetical protein
MQILIYHSYKEGNWEIDFHVAVCLRGSAELGMYNCLHEGHFITLIVPISILIMT